MKDSLAAWLSCREYQDVCAAAGVEFSQQEYDRWRRVRWRLGAHDLELDMQEACELMAILMQHCSISAEQAGAALSEMARSLPPGSFTSTRKIV